MLIDREELTSHIDDGENKIKMRRILDKIQIVLNNHTIETTDFLDPYERRLAISILNRFQDIEYIEYGGFQDAERKVIAIFPQYMYEEDIPEEISMFKVEGELELLNHRDYLGALLNLGIIREKIGDILVHEDFGFIVVKKQVSSYIEYNFQKIGNQNISIKPISKKELILPAIKYKEIKDFLTSLRLDVVISSAYKLSRKNSSKLVESGSVKVNWEPINKGFLELSAMDIVSVKGYGRFILQEVGETSRKGRLLCKIRILI